MSASSVIKSIDGIMKKLSKSFVLGVCLGIAAVAGAEELAPVNVDGQLFPTPDYRGDIFERSTILGDLDGVRQEVANGGVTIDGNLTQVWQGVASGGINQDEEYMGRGEVIFNMDTAKMGMWPGGLLTVMGEGKYGSRMLKNTGMLWGSNTNDLLPDLDNGFVLPQFTYTQFLSKKFGLAFGKFATITSTAGDMNEFAHGKGADKFLNPSFNFNPVTALTIPYSTLGVSAIFLPTDRLALSLAALDSHGTPGSSGFSDLYQDGVTIASEGRYTTEFFDKKGHQLLGATYSTSDYADLDQRAANFIIPGLPTKEANESWSVFWNMDQYFYQPHKAEDRGAGFFARAGFSDGEANPVRSFASFGLGGKGVGPCREDDGFGLGYFYAWVADSEITDKAGFGDSQGVEAYYEVAVTPAIKLTPDAQWIAPSQERIDSAWIFALRLNTAF